MSKARVFWLLCIGRLVSKTDNILHLAHLAKQVGVYYILMTKILLTAW